MLFEKKTCDRCPREETTPITLEQAVEAAKKPVTQPPALSVVVDGTALVSFKHLCAACNELVAGYIGQISKTNTKASSVRERQTKDAKPKTPKQGSQA